jgi:hypothetical protein
MSYANGPKIVTDGLVLCLDAGNSKSYGGSGTVWNDLSGNNNNGTLTNGPTFDSNNRGNIVFDGVNDFVQLSTTITLNTGTFIVWLKRNGNQGQYDGIMISRGGSGGNVTGINLQASNQIGYHWNDNSNTWSWQNGLVAPDSNWCMAAISVSATSATAYLCKNDGISFANNNVSHSSTAMANIQIGQDNFSGTRFYAGNISQTYIYNRSLSSQEIEQNFNATKGRFNL